MPAHIGNHPFNNGKSAYAGQAVPAEAGRRQTGATTEAEEPARSRDADTVTLSAGTSRTATTADIPKQTLRAWRNQIAAANENAATEAEQTLREDRIFTIVSVLSMMHYTGEANASIPWPGGLPAPSSEELAIAGQRLARRERLRPDSDGDTPPQTMQPDNRDAAGPDELAAAS